MELTNKEVSDNMVYPTGHRAGCCCGLCKRFNEEEDAMTTEEFAAMQQHHAELEKQLEPIFAETQSKIDSLFPGEQLSVFVEIR